MSVINKMLQELDRREAMASSEGPLPPQQVKAVKAVTGHEWFWRVVAALLLAAVAWAGWVAYQLRPAAVATELAFKAAEGARAPKGVVKPAPQAAAAKPPAPAPLPPKPSAETPPAPAAQPAPETMRLATAIQTPIVEKAEKPVPVPQKKQEPATKSAPVGTPAPAAKAAPASKPKPEPALALSPAKPATKPSMSLNLDVPQARVAPAAPARVERRERIVSANERAEREFRRGVELLKQGRGPEAEEGFAAALAQDPAHRGARQALVALALERGQLENARRLLNEGLAIDPAQPDFAVALARILIERRDYAGALAALQKTSGPATEQAEFQLMRATVLQRLGRHGEAAESYKASLQSQASSPHAWIGLGISLEALKQRPEAADAFRRALAAGPANDELKSFAEQRIRALR